MAEIKSLAGQLLSRAAAVLRKNSVEAAPRRWLGFFLNLTCTDSQIAHLIKLNGLQPRISNWYELTYLRCTLNFAVERKYIAENPAHGVKLFDERRERPVKRMLTLQGEQRILENAPPYLRVAIVLLAQTGGRTYTEGFSLRWDQIEFDHKVMFFGGDTKTEGSSEPVPLTGLAHDVLLTWKREQAGKSPFLFPSPVMPDKPISSIRKAWKTTLKNAKVAYFPIYHFEACVLHAPQLGCA